MINNTITSNQKNKRTFVSIAASIAALCLFTLSLNMSETFAETLHQIPVIKNIASVLTIRDYDFTADNITGEVTIPEVIIEDDQLEEYINDTINSKIETTLAEATLRADEYKEAYLETGGTEEGYADKNMNITVDYELYVQTDEYLSFRVFTHESLAAVYAENLYMNINLITQETLSLEDVLDEDYLSRIATTVKTDVNVNPDLYFDDVKDDEWLPREDTDFYINDVQEIVVVFNKYELAPGARGRLEFKLKMQ